MNHTADLVLGESRGAWVLGLLAFSASLLLGIAALMSSKRAIQSSHEANSIAKQGIEAQFEAATTQRLHDARDHWLRELEGSLHSMALVSGKNPLPPGFPVFSSIPLAGVQQPQDFYDKLLPIFGAFQEFGALMRRVVFLDGELARIGYPITWAGGVTKVFPEFEQRELEEMTETLGAVVHAVGDFLGHRTSRPDWVLLRSRYDGVREYWSTRWFNLPSLKAVLK